MSKLIKLFASNLCSLLYVNHTHTQRETGKEDVFVCVCVCVCVCEREKDRATERKKDGRRSERRKKEIE